MSPSSNSGILDSIQNLFGSLFGIGNPDREKKRLLKEIRKELKRYGKYFKVGSGMAQSQMANFFYNTYKVVGPMYALLSPYLSSELLKLAFIQIKLPDEDKLLDERLNEASIRERAKDTNLKTLREEVKNDLIQLYGIYDSNRIRLINSLYNHFLCIVDFSGFDYFFTLKKFDSSLQELNFGNTPKFNSINGEYVLEDLKDFLSVLEPVDTKMNWDIIFDILSTYRNTELINSSSLKKTMKACDEIKSTGVFKLIIMSLCEDPSYKTTTLGNQEEIVESYLEKKKRDAERVLQTLVKEKKVSQIESLVKTVFGTTAVSRTQNYTTKANINFTKRGSDGFLYIEGLNYLKAFYLDTYKSGTRRLVDILLIEGTWTSNLLSQQFSENYHQLLELSEAVIDFDNNLSEEAPLGQRLKRAAKMVSPQDRGSLNILQSIVDEVNEEAYSLVKRSATGLISLGKVFKQLIEDHKEINHEVIINWKELESRSEKPLAGELTEMYKLLYYFVQLLQSVLTKNTN